MQKEEDRDICLCSCYLLSSKHIRGVPSLYRLRTTNNVYMGSHAIEHQVNLVVCNN